MTVCHCKATVREEGTAGPFHVREFTITINTPVDPITNAAHRQLHAELIAGIRAQGYEVGRLLSHRHVVARETRKESNTG